MNVFSRSWELSKASFKVIREEKELILYPILAGVFSLAFILLMFFPLIISYLSGNPFSTLFTITQYILLLITYFGIAFIATFFNVCVVYTSAIRFSGKNAEVSKTFQFAFSKIHIIFLWSIFSASVGLVLKILEDVSEKAKGAGKIILLITRGIFGVVWNLLTLFVIQVMVYEDVGVFGAISKSTQVLKKTWGESLVKAAGLGLIASIFIIFGFIIFTPIIILSGSNIYAILILFILLIIYELGVFLFFGVADSVFNTALYIYATTGKAVGTYSPEALKDSIKSQSNKLISGL